MIPVKKCDRCGGTLRLVPSELVDASGAMVKGRMVLPGGFVEFCTPNLVANLTLCDRCADTVAKVLKG